MLKTLNQKIRVILVVLTTSFSSAAFTQDLLTVQDAIDAALKHNYDIETVRLDSSSYAIDNEYTNAVFLPQFNGTATRVFNSNNQKQQLSDGSVKERNGIKS